MSLNIFNVCILILLLLSGCVDMPASKLPNEANERPPQTPFVWGNLSECKGCIIFKENKRTDVGFYVIAFTWKNYRELEVLESIGYDLPQKIWIDNQENKDKLHYLAIKEGIRYVKLTEDYTPKELEMARELCRKPVLDTR